MRWAQALFGEGKSGKKGVFIILALTLVSKSMGFVREVLVAYFFGAGQAVDAFVVAYTIYTLAVLLPGVLFPAVGTSILVEQGIKRGPAHQKRVFASFFSLALVASGCLILFILLAGPLLVRIVAPLFSPESQALALKLLYIMLPITPGIMLVQLSTAYYNARRRFGLPQTSGMILNAVIIAAMFAGAGAGIYALGAGWALGYLAAGLALSLPVLAGARWLASLRAPEVKEFLVLSGPLLLSYAFHHINTTVDRMFASSLPAGSISYLYYGNRIFEIPMLAITALGTVHLTKASEMAASVGLKELKRFTFGLMKKGALVALPASVLLLVFARPLASLIFQHGAFGAGDTGPTAGVLMYLSPALLPVLVYQLAVATFRGTKDVKVLLLISITGMVFNLTGDALLIGPLGVNGLAAASTINACLNALLLVWLMGRRLR